MNCSYYIFLIIFSVNWFSSISSGSWFSHVESEPHDNMQTLTNHLEQLNIQSSICPELVDAAERGEVENVTRLLDSGIDINATDNDGNTALLVAAERNHKAIVDLLVKKDADVNKANNTGHTPLLIVESYSQKYSEYHGITKYLRDRGAHLGNQRPSDAITVAQPRGYRAYRERFCGDIVMIPMNASKN